MEEEKLHWYAFSFNFQSGSTSGHACAYIGYPEQKVTIPRIEDAKKAAGIKEGSGAVLIGLAYMGHMTETDVTTRD